MGGASSHPDEVEQWIARSVPDCEARLVDLGVTQVLVRSNTLGFSGFRYFARTEPVSADFTGADYELHCIDLDGPHALHEATLRQSADRSFRGQRFLSGFYLTHHFGPPAYLIARGDRVYVIGRRLDRVVWGWYIKYVLLLDSVRKRMINLKAACFALRGVGTLLIG